MENPKLGDFVDVIYNDLIFNFSKIIAIFCEGQENMQYLVTLSEDVADIILLIRLRQDHIDDFTSDSDYSINKNINSYIDNYVRWFHPTDIMKVHPRMILNKYPNGCKCRECSEHYPYAEPNQQDGTLLCYSCRIRG